MRSADNFPRKTTCKVRRDLLLKKRCRAQTWQPNAFILHSYNIYTLGAVILAGASKTQGSASGHTNRTARRTRSTAPAPAIPHETAAKPQRLP